MEVQLIQVIHDIVLAVIILMNIPLRANKGKCKIYYIQYRTPWDDTIVSIREMSLNTFSIEGEFNAYKKTHTHMNILFMVHSQ